MGRRARPWPLAGGALGLAIVIFVLAPRYNDAQRAGDVAAFRSVVEAGTPWRFAVAAVVDIAFAATYGLLGLTLGWRDRPAEGRRGRRVRRVGGTAIALGAAADVVEDILVLTNTLGRATVSEAAIDVMRTFGHAKWALAATGAVALAAARLRRG
jgi:hypothetical protein